MISEAIKNCDRAVIPYVTAGVPSLDETGEILKALAAAGAPVIEIGLPFSDPMADGPVLQRAGQIAIENGFNLDEFFAKLPEWAKDVDAELVIMSYINPLMARGLNETLKLFKNAGISGVIIPDLPSDAAEVFSYCQSIELDLIRLVAPTTLPERQQEVVKQCSGFVYAVSVKGVTGARAALPQEVQNQVESIKKMTDLPVCIGFGVSNAEQVDGLLAFGDGVIVGSYLMKRLQDEGGDSIVNDFEKLL